jgi:FtsP/CotA-like multicopper oxidase with cupredoxin domain
MWLIRPKRKLAEIARKNRQEIIDAKLSRRDLFTLGLLGAGGYLVATKGLSSRAEASDPVSPPTTPFMEPLAFPAVKTPVSSLSPAPQQAPLAGEGRTRPHQGWPQFAPVLLYELRHQQAPHSFHPQLPTQNVWGYDGAVPGPTFHAHYGQPILIRNFNDLPQNHVGFGSPQVSRHTHNGHTPSESDGFPCDFFPLNQGGPELFYDQHLPNVLAGFTDPQYAATMGDPREAMSTLWYHDHRIDFTAQNTYKGLAGFYLLFNDQDTGDETTGYRLPSGNYDVPLALADKVFDESGQLYYDLFNLDGILGDKFTVNGKIQPFFQVARRRYRFRFLNTGPSRFYQLHITNPNNLSQIIQFYQIANDGNLLPQGIQTNKARMSVAERVDIILDFSQFAPGTTLYLENRLEQKDGRGPTNKIKAAGRGDYLMRFDIVLPDAPDFSAAPPYSYYALPPMTAVSRSRTWKFDRTNGQWAVNNILMDPTCSQVLASIPIGSAEHWTFENSSGGWQHPIHNHFEEFQIVNRNGAPPPNYELARKDVVWLNFNEQVKVFSRFRDFTGRYPMHCHNVVHEDHAMMFRWDIV